jgi:hypothetical protein
LAKTGNIEGVVYWHIASYFSGAPDARANKIVSQLLAPNGVAATRVTSGDRVAQALEPHFRRVYGVELIDELIPAVEGKIKQTLADLSDWVKKHPVETALLVAVGTDMAITLLNQYSPPRSEEEANIRSVVQNAARYIAAGLSAGLQVRDMTLFFLALQTGTKTIALETGIGILLWAATNLLYLTLTGQWGKEFLIGKTCARGCDVPHDRRHLRASGHLRSARRLKVVHGEGLRYASGREPGRAPAVEDQRYDVWSRRLDRH